MYWLSHEGLVSIPSSSGHQFTGAFASYRFVSFCLRCFNPFFIRASVYWVIRQTTRRLTMKTFQSLLHQGISLLYTEQRDEEEREHRFNPFFIRASVYCVRRRRGPVPAPAGFNPFFIRASVYWIFWLEPAGWRICNVSIPSSSGHQFTEGEA